MKVKDKVATGNPAQDTGAVTGGPARPLHRAAMLALGCLAAGAAQANVGAIAGAEQTLQGLLAFFADPENVRGLFGAAAGAVASVIAARPFNRTRRPPVRRPGSAAPPTDDR